MKAYNKYLKNRVLREYGELEYEVDEVELTFKDNAVWVGDTKIADIKWVPGEKPYAIKVEEVNFTDEFDFAKVEQEEKEGLAESIQEFFDEPPEEGKEYKFEHFITVEAEATSVDPGQQGGRTDPSWDPYVEEFEAKWGGVDITEHLPDRDKDKIAEKLMDEIEQNARDAEAEAKYSRYEDY